MKSMKGSRKEPKQPKQIISPNNVINPKYDGIYTVEESHTNKQLTSLDFFMQEAAQDDSSAPESKAVIPSFFQALGASRVKTRALDAETKGTPMWKYAVMLIMVFIIVALISGLATWALSS